MFFGHLPFGHLSFDAIEAGLVAHGRQPPEGYVPEVRVRAQGVDQLYSSLSSAGLRYDLRLREDCLLGFRRNSLPHAT